MAQAWIRSAVAASVRQGVVPAAQPKALVLCEKHIHQTIDELVDAFPPTALHTFAAKANPLEGALKTIAAKGIGCEVASIGEWAMACKAFPPEKIVYDSPVKTLEELKTALYTPCFLNVDNFQELELVAGLHAERPIVATVGMRINPQIGAGVLGQLSTGMAHSKFGVGLDDYRSEILEAYRTHTFLKMVHMHTGSQGIGIPLMAAAVEEMAGLVLDELVPLGVTWLDIGGGLPVNFASDAATPTFAEYASALQDKVPRLFECDAPVRLVTEFGRAIIAKAGVLLSKIEYTKYNGGRFILQQHCGADLLVRTVWAPQDWKLRVEVFDGVSGEPRTGDCTASDVAGPCCLGSDLAASNVMLPKATLPGDVVVIKDVGGYFHSGYSYYNLREAPAVYVFEGEGDAGRLRCIRKAATTADTIAFMVDNSAEA